MALLLASSLACSSAPETPSARDASTDVSRDATPTDTPAADAAPPSDAPPRLNVKWQPCGTFGGQADPRALCASVDVPLDHANPGGERISLYVRHKPALTPSGRALWILMGGPGQSGQDGEPLANVLAQRDPGLDIYVPDHRGTGSSEYLGCPTAEAPDSLGGPGILPSEWPSCRDEVVATWGARLRHFSATSAARDLRALIDATRATDTRAFVLGVSYGTYLANRYLQIAPSQPAGVILDSVCPGDGCHLSRHDPLEDEVARGLLARCADEPDCARRLGPDPVQRLRDLHRRVAMGHCALAPTPAQNTWLLRSALGNMMMSAPQRRLLAAVVYRMERCGAPDRAALSFLYERLYGPNWALVASIFAQPAAGAWLPMPTGTPPLGGGGMLQGYSFPLAINILTSELWETADPSPAELVRRWTETLVCRGVARQASWQVPGWPRYSDPLAGRVAETDVPLLALNAEVDPATPAPLARTIAARLSGSHQRYIEIPGASHSVVAQGALVGDTTTTCGRELILQFVRDPRATLDTSCLARTIPHAFAASAQLSRLYFDTDSLWGDP
jgi:pimeloyl-ACP methyl ester carboxylesterase